ncbi:MAG: cytochrome c biogenesis protein ResB, partial [Pirellulaceae bacterium]
GLLVTFVGVGLTVFVIFSGQAAQGLQGVPSFVTEEFGWTPIWSAIKYGLLPASIISTIATSLALVFVKRRTIEGMLVGAIALLLFGLGVLLWAIIPGFRLDDSALRILWQLLQGGLAAIVLLVGCLLAFKQRGGIVVLHAGVGLLIVGMFYVAYFAVEEQMTIEEGEASSEAVDIRHVELAIVDRSPKEHDAVAAVPRTRLQEGKRLSDKTLPFDVQLVKYLPNSSRDRPLNPGEPTPATQGFGKFVTVEPRRIGAGADTGGAVDVASAFVRFLDRKSGDDLGTYLLSQWWTKPQQVKLGAKSYEVQLRFKTAIKPYEITLKDVRKDDYMGTDTPMNYSSEIRLKDERYDVDRTIKIWMNNPLRYAGETFYQTSYFFDPRTRKESTTLSIVTNTGWMMPYLACMIVGIGLLAHFWIVLVRFLRRLMAGELKGGDGASAGRPRGDIVDAQIVSPVEPARRPGKPGKGGRRREPVVAKIDRPALSMASIIAPGIAVLLVAGWLGFAA